MAHNGSGKKVANSLVAVSASAVLAVYAAGYARTRAAADRFEAQSDERRPAAPEGRDRPANSTADSAPPDRTLEKIVDSPRSDPETMASLERAPVAPTTPAPEQSPAEHEADAAASAPAASAPESAPVVASVAPAPTLIPTPVPTPAPSAPPPAPAAPEPKWKDGTYTGWGTSRHGDIQASVVIEGGRIVSATIAQCLTRYSCDVIDRLPPQVHQRQSAEVDYVSGATQSTNAFYYAVVEALGKAK